MNGVQRCERYVREVLKKGACYPETIKLAARRHLSDKKRTEFYFDKDAANTAVEILELMPHTKGELQGQLLVLEGWQCFAVCSLFGWKWSDTGLRRFKYGDIFVPRKNGKTALAVGIALLMLGPDNEPGAEVFLGATGERHAKRLLYRPAKYIVDHWEEYSYQYNIEAGASSIVRTDNDSLLTTVIRDPGDGDSPHCAVVDEYHEHKESDQYDTFDTGMGARRQPLLLITTTAGFNLGSPCKTEHEECRKILNGSLVADDKFVLLYEPDEDDEWDDIETLKKVNPNFGVSVTEHYLKSKLEAARQSAEKQTKFKTKHLNIWVGAQTQWMNMLLWQRQAKKSLSLDDFEGAECHITCDLASKIDVAALHITFKRKGHFFSFPFFYVPESAVERIKEYQQFVSAGDMIVTPGNKTDYEFIEKQIIEFSARFDVLSIAFDPAQATYLVTRLEENRSLSDKCIDFPQNRKNISEPMQELEAAVMDREYWHDGNTCMTWMIGNTCNKKDAGERHYPVKENRNDDKCHIDGSVSAIMGVARWMEEAPDTESVVIL